MKLRKFFTLVLHLLLVFGFCLPLIAEEIAEEYELDLPSISEIEKLTKPKTLDEAKTAFDDLDHYYDVALDKTLDAKFAHVQSELTVVLLQGAFDLKKSEKDAKLKETAQGIYDSIEAIGLDPLDIISDVAVAIVKGIKDGWDYNTLRKQKNNVEKALNAQKTKSGELEEKANSAEEYSKLILVSKHKVFKIKKALESPLTYSLSCPSYVLKGELIKSSFEINRACEWVKWYIKAPDETGLGSLINTVTVIPNSYPKVMSISFTVDDGNVGDNYVVTAQAKVSSTGKVVSDSSTVTYVETGIYFNQQEFIAGADETLEVMIVYKDLYLASLNMGGDKKDENWANGNHVMTLSTVIDSSYSVGKHNILIEGWIGISDSSFFTHYDSIVVIQPGGYSDNGMYFSAYDEYNAEIFDYRPILVVYWYVKPPGGAWEGVKLDKVNGGKSSSMSYSFSSKSKTGEYKVYAVVFLDVDKKTYVIYERTIYVD